MVAMVFGIYIYVIYIYIYNGSNQEQFNEYVIYLYKSIWIQWFDFGLEYKVGFKIHNVFLCLLEVKTKSLGNAETSLNSSEGWVLICRRA